MKLGTAAIMSGGLPTPGTPFGGGYYVGRMLIASISYALILAPKASGESASLQLKVNNINTPGVTSVWDGAANTAAMIADGAANYPAANFCKNLSIGGFTDWILPAMDQMELCYRIFKPDSIPNYSANNNGDNQNSYPIGAPYTPSVPAQTTVDAFKAGGAQAFETADYWTSTQNTTTQNIIHRFTDGGQAASNKSTSLRVRAVRMIRI